MPPSSTGRTMGGLHGPNTPSRIWLDTATSPPPGGAFTLLKAMERAREAQGGHKSGHNDENQALIPQSLIWD